MRPAAAPPDRRCCRPLPHHGLAGSAWRTSARGCPRGASGPHGPCAEPARTVWGSDDRLGAGQAAEAPGAGVTLTRVRIHVDLPIRRGERTCRSGSIFGTPVMVALLLSSRRWRHFAGSMTRVASVCTTGRPTSNADMSPVQTARPPRHCLATVNPVHEEAASLRDKL